MWGDDRDSGNQWPTCGESETTTGTNSSILLGPTGTHRYYDWTNPVPFNPPSGPTGQKSRPTASRRAPS
jgi:hypothetical protein